MSAEKKRAHARVESDIACVVDGNVEGRIRNLSSGGALLFGPVGYADIDDTVALEFPSGEGAPFTAVGEVLRVTQRGTYAEYGIAFVTFEAEDREQLERCIELVMAGKGVERRAAPRLYRRVEVRCHTEDDFYATMNNISRDGLGLECEVPLKPGEKVTVELLVGAKDSPLEVSGIVKHVRLGEGGLHLIGLRFDPLSTGQRARLDELIQSVLRGH